MFKTKVLLAIALLSLVFLGSVLTFPAKAFPGDKPAIMVEPATIQNPSLVVGSTFIINLTLYNATIANVPLGIAGIEVHLYWNNSVIQPLSFVSSIGALGGAMAGLPFIYGLSPGFFDIGEHRINSAPYTNASFYEVSAASTSGGWNGNGLIASINFTVVSIGKSPFTLTFTDVNDAQAAEIDHYVQDGSFNNMPPPVLPGPAAIYVSPASVINSSMVPPSSFNANINVMNATNLANFSFVLTFNASVLQAASATWSWNNSSAGITVNNILGTINGSTAVSPTITGNAPLTTLTFNVTSLGETSLHIASATMYDNNGNAIPFSSSDGYFNNMLITSIYVDPSFRMDPNLRPGNTTGFGIVAQNFVNVQYCQFDLRFNPKVVKLLSYIVISPIGSSYLDAQMISFNNTAGDLNVVFVYNQSVSVASFPLMNLTFLVTGYGSSSLNLNSSTLIDQNGNPIQHQSVDGLLVVATRDVAILAITVSPLKLYAGRIVTINVTASNLGNFFNESFTVTTYVDNVIIGSQNVTDLQTSTNATLTFYWNATGQEGSLHTFSASASFVPYEINTTNNAFTCAFQVKIKLLGDINGDGTVNLLDLVLFTQAYGSTIGSPNYNSEADMNNDGKINLTDLVTLSMNYGRSLPNDP